MRNTWNAKSSMRTIWIRTYFEDAGTEETGEEGCSDMEDLKCVLSEEIVE